MLKPVCFYPLRECILVDILINKNVALYYMNELEKSGFGDRAKIRQNSVNGEIVVFGNLILNNTASEKERNLEIENKILRQAITELQNLHGENRELRGRVAFYEGLLNRLKKAIPLFVIYLQAL